MHDPERPRVDDEQAPVDWDAWERSHMAKGQRWRLLLMVATMVLMIALWFTTNGDYLPWAPP